MEFIATNTTQNTFVKNMTPTNFCYWLQGFCEICGQKPSQKQWEIIKEHLALASGKTIEIKPTPTKPKTTCNCGKTEAEQKDCSCNSKNIC
jgi:hypothetical protein